MTGLTLLSFCYHPHALQLQLLWLALDIPEGNTQLQKQSRQSTCMTVNLVCAARMLLQRPTDSSTVLVPFSSMCG